jgi:hypothetical protein
VEFLCHEQVRISQAVENQKRGTAEIAEHAEKRPGGSDVNALHGDLRELCG